MESRLKNAGVRRCRKTKGNQDTRLQDDHQAGRAARIKTPCWQRPAKEQPRTQGTNSNGNPGKVFIPAGLVIPRYRRTGLYALNIRRAVVPEGQKKYHLVRGSAAVAFVHCKPGLHCVIVESELDAITIAQEAPGLCSVIAIPAGNRPDAQTAEFIRAAPDVLYAGDFDDPGKQAFAFWRDNFSCRAWPPATGKDIGDMHKAGVPVRSWIEAGLAPKTPQDAPGLHEAVRGRYPGHRRLFPCRTR